MFNYEKDILIKLQNILEKHINCIDLYNDITDRCNKTLLSKGIDLYGMFWPEKELGKYFTYHGKLTKNEKKKNYKYFFDDEEKLRITERYDDDGKLLNIIFYLYYEKEIEIVWYCNLRNIVFCVGYVDYINNILHSFVESGYFIRGNSKNIGIKSFSEYVFDEDKEFVLKKVYSEEMFTDGKEWKTISKMKRL